jgi:PBSX family phage terminase large subunit
MIFGKNKGSIYKNILIDLFEIVGKENYSYNQQSGELWLFGKQFFCMGAQDEGAAASILGMTIGIAVCDEIVKYPRSFVMQLFLRMSPTGSRLYATTNPDNPYHYLKTEVIDNPKFAPDLTVLEFTLDDNPNIDEDEKRRIKASQVGVFYLRFILGRWVAAEGAIYRDCWPKVDLYEADKIIPSIYGWGGYVDHLVFCDVGTANPQVYLEAIDDGRGLWIDREYYWDSNKEMRQKTGREYADDLQAWLSPEGYRDSNGILSMSRVMRRNQPRIVVDPAAADFRLELTSRGFWVIEANNDVLDGIRRVSSVMSRGLLHVNNECEHLIREAPGYIWDEKALKVGDEQPVKTADHSLDALRYGCMEVYSDYRLIAA